MYTCFGAATAGCLPCVQYSIEVRGVSLTATSERCGYTIEAFAEWANEHDKKDPTANHTAVLQYLRDLSGPVGVPDVTAPLTGVWAPVDGHDL